MSSTLIAILKADANEKVKNEEIDPYVKILRNNGMRAEIIPTLSFHFINKELLQKHLMHSENFHGIIFTSARAVEAVYSIISSLPEDVLNKWKLKTNYCVGQSTSKLAKTLLQFTCLGEECGNSDNLCNLILSTNIDSILKSFLFPCSSLKKDTVCNTLNATEGFNVIEVTCYETVCNPSLTEFWKKFISDQGLPNIIIFFSSSGVNFCHKLITESYKNIFLPKIIAIGKSTEKTLLDFNLSPCKVASKPNPEAVFECVMEIIN